MKRLIHEFYAYLLYPLLAIGLLLAANVVYQLWLYSFLAILFGGFAIVVATLTYTFIKDPAWDQVTMGTFVTQFTSYLVREYRHALDRFTHAPQDK